MAIQVPRGYLYAGGAVVLGGLGFILYRKRSQAANATSTTNSGYLGPLPGSAIIEPIQTIPGPPGPPGAKGGPGPKGPPGPPGKNPPPVKKPPPKKKPPPQPPPPVAASVPYTVKQGDTLSDIAEDYYGIPADWNLIYNANRRVIGANPNLIYPGEELIIPSPKYRNPGEV